MAERAQRSRWRSVRARTTTGATAVVAVGLGAAGLLVLTALRGNLVESASLQAEHTARDIVAQLDAGTALDRLRLPDPEDEPVQVVSLDGTVLAADEALRGRAPMAGFGPHGDAETDDEADSEEDEDDDEDGDESASDEDPEEDDAVAAAEPVAGGTGGTTRSHSLADPVFGDIELIVDEKSGADRFRVAALSGTAPTGRPVTVYAGASLDTADSAVADARTAMLTGLPLLLALVAGVTWLVTRRALRPVEAIRTELAEIMHGDLSRRVPEPGSRDEIARLAVTTNDTLAALEESARRQRRFIADAAHELRSPIASLRTQLEVAQAHPGLLEPGGLLADTVRLEHLAADLLLLARLDAGEQPRTDRVALEELIRDELAHRPPGRIPVEFAGPEVSLIVLGSRTQLARVVGNLVDNAQRHAATTVRVGLAGTGGSVVLDVADDGPGVPEADRARIFRRFVRLDDARSRDDGGAGLGLAIVRDIVERHRGSIHCETAALGGARFVVVLPPADDLP